MHTPPPPTHLLAHRKKSGPQNMTRNEHLAPSMLWEIAALQKTNKTNKQKNTTTPPHKKMEAKKAQTINKEVFATLRKIEKFFPKRWKTELQITAQGHPWKRPPTHRYSVRSTAAVRSQMTIRQYRRVTAYHSRNAFVQNSERP